MRKTITSFRFAVVVAALSAVAACAPAAAPSPTSPPAKPAPASAPAASESQPAATTAPAKQAAKPAATQAPAKPAASPATKPAFDEQAVADFYKGKTVKVIVGYSAGGGYDTYARAIARHLGNNIPGNPTVIVENMAGAGGLLATNTLANSAAKDGTVILHVGGSAILKQLAGDPGVEYDAANFQYLGAPFVDNTLLVVKKETGVSKLEEVLAGGSKQLVLGGLAPGSPQDVAATLLRDVLKANVKLVSGYGGTSQARLAMDRGEVDGLFNSWESIRATNREQIESGEWVVLTQVSEEPIAGFANIPLLSSFANDDQQRQIIRFTTLVPYQFARPFIVAPDVPQDRVRALQAAFDQTLADKTFLADAEKAQLTIEPVKGEKIRSLVQEFLQVSGDLKDNVVKVLAPEG